MGTSTVEHEVTINHLAVHMQIAITIKEDGDAASPSPSPSPPPPPPPPLLLPPPHPPAPTDVTEKSFRVGRSYHVLSADGEHVLSASNRMSDRPSKNGGFRIDFNEDRLWKTRGPSARFMFSGQPGEYRMHSGIHNNNMLYLCGPDHQNDWVVWDCAVPTNGDWEVMKLQWRSDGKRFRIKCFEGFFVKWAVSGFTGVKEWDSATDFILHEI